MRVASAVLALLLVNVVAGAQEVRVAESSGIAEIELPGSGWLQAVSGRALPAGGTVATWVNGSLSVSGRGTRVDLGPLSVLDLLVDSPDHLVFGLRVGTLTAAATGVPMVLRVPLAEVVLADARVRYVDGVLTVVAGTVEVRYARGGERTISSPAAVNLAERPVVPVF